jgi:hypothetical protein
MSSLLHEEESADGQAFDLFGCHFQLIYRRERRGTTGKTAMFVLGNGWKDFGFG